MIQYDSGRVHYASAPVAVVVPLAQAVITGVLIGLPIGALSWLAGFSNPWKVVLVVWLVVQGCAWLVLLFRWARLVELVERSLGVDLNADGFIGEPPVERIDPIRVEILDRPDRKTTFVDLPASPEQLRLLVAGVARGAPLSETFWTGAGRPFSKAEFHELRQAMLKGGLLVPRNERAPAQGFQLTLAGKHLIRRACEQLETPTPTLTHDTHRENV